MASKEYYVYILASKKYGTLYVGITSHLIARIYKHKDAAIDSFTKKYEVNRLVYYEVHGDVLQAITREKQIKKWRREWKINLIEENNPQWLDMYRELL